MKLADLYHEAILWTCYLENYPEPERFLKIHNLTKNDRILFDLLGKFFPFDEFYVRNGSPRMPGAIDDLRLSGKSLVLPWMYRPASFKDTLYGKHVICPSAEMYNFLDNKIEVKKLLKALGIPTPQWAFVNDGTTMLEKPICDSAGGVGLRLTPHDPCEGHFLEDYIHAYRSVGLQFILYDKIEFICADEMLYHPSEKKSFQFHSQKNIQKDELASPFIEDCFNLLEYLLKQGYKGFIGIDALIGGDDHYVIEVNPRGIAFLPAFFAASAFGWTSYMTYMKRGLPDTYEIVLLDFGRIKRVVRKIY